MSFFMVLGASYGIFEILSSCLLVSFVVSFIDLIGHFEEERYLQL